MRKHLIGTILVLAALAACNKEIDTQTLLGGRRQDFGVPDRQREL